MARLTSPTSTAVIDVPDELVGRYEAAGWKAEKPKAKTTSKSEK